LTYVKYYDTIYNNMARVLKVTIIIIYGNILFVFD